MKKSKSLVLGSLLGSIVLVNTLSAGDINASQIKLTAFDGANYDQFGESVAISGNYAIVGASADDSSKGGAYLYELNGTDINSSQIKLTANDSSSSDSFGRSVSINDNYVIVGAFGDDSRKGSAYLYELNASDINVSQIKLTASDGVDSDYFGYSVAIDANYTIVGAYQDDSGKGSAYVYELNATDINNSQIKLTASSGNFGNSVAISNNYAIVGAYQDDSGKGSAYLYELNASDINASQIKLSASDGNNNDSFGRSVSINDNYVIVTANGNDNSKGSAYLYELNATDINASQIKLMASDRISNDYFGWSVAISNSYAIIGSYQSNSDKGSAYLYELNASDINASQIKLTTPTSLELGYSVAIDANYTIVGAWKNNLYTGNAYLFNLNNSFALATNVAISGSIDIGQILTGSYDYSDADSDSESGSTYKWYRADDNSGTNASAINGATFKTYTISTLDSGKYLAFEVTPNDGISAGSAVKSSYTSMVPIKIDFNSSIITANSWNMISVPDERNISVSSISGATIWTFNNSNNAWENPSTLEAGKGYLLYTTSSIGLVSADKVSSTITSDYTTIKNIENNNSWTLVGISKSTSGVDWVDIYNPDNTLKSNCEYTQIFYYDSVNGTWNTSSKVPYLAGIWVRQNSCTNNVN